MSKRWLVGVAGMDPIEIFVLVNARDGGPLWTRPSRLSGSAVRASRMAL